MNNIFVSLDYKKLSTFDPSWEDQISQFFCKQNKETPSNAFWRLILDILKKEGISDKNTLLEKLARSLLTLFLEADYIDPSRYSRLISPNDISLTPISKNIFNIFSVNNTKNTNYINELIDFLMLSYGYSSTITQKPIHTTNKILLKYQQVMRMKKKENPNVLIADTADTNIFYDTLRRIKKQDPHILSPFITTPPKKRIPIELESGLDIEIVSNLLRYSNGSKNPFISNSNKTFKMKSFLNSVKKISFNNIFLDIETLNIQKSQLIAHNQYIFERMTNVNYLFNLYTLHRYIEINYDNPLALNHLFEELDKWICFPLLTIRLRILKSILILTGNLSLLESKGRDYLLHLLKAIRIYYSCFLLPILITAFHYMVNALREETHNNTNAAKELITWLNQNKIFQPEKRLETEDINKNLEKYFSNPTVKGHLLYFDTNKAHLTPMASYYHKIIPTFDLSLWDKEELNKFNVWSHELYKKFIKETLEIERNTKTLCTPKKAPQLAPLVFQDLYKKGYLPTLYTKTPKREKKSTTAYQERKYSKT